MFGAFWAVRWIGCIWLLLWLAGASSSVAVHPVGCLAVLIANAAYLWFGCALGTFFSLRSKNSARSLTATILTLITMNGLYLILLTPFQGDSTFPLVGCTPFVNAAFLASYGEVSQFLGGQFPRPWYSALDLICTGMVSIAAYGVAALAITYYLVTNFDDVLDRPRTVGGKAPRRSFSSKPPYKAVNDEV